VLGLGVVLAGFLSIVFCRKCDVFREFKATPKAFLYTFVYLLVFAVELIKSNLDVAARVINPKLPINPGIVEVKTRLTSPMGRMILANSITLTPGTLTVDIQEDRLFIHWIDVKAEGVEEATNAIVKRFEKYLEEIYG
jgi:multicomponent Na+:H+ antiporter subunit E